MGARRPHKNQRVLVEALAEFRDRHPDLGLVLVGQPDPRFPDEVTELVDTLGLSDHVRQYTRADDECLQDLYANAAVFAYPSLVEGFGMPLLEAMASGASSRSERCRSGSGDCEWWRPDRAGLDAGRWVEAIDQVLSNPDLAQELRVRGRGR